MKMDTSASELLLEIAHASSISFEFPIDAPQGWQDAPRAEWEGQGWEESPLAEWEGHGWEDPPRVEWEG